MSATRPPSLPSPDDTDKSRRGRSQVDFDLNLRTYLTLGYGEVTYDKFQNLALRVRAGSGAGLRVIREINTHWVIEATVTGSYTEYRRVEQGEEKTENGVELRLATRFWTEVLNDDLKLDVTLESFLGLRDIENTTHRVQATLSYEIMSNFTINLTAIFDRNESPQTRDDGTRPDRNDLQLSFGLGLKL